MQLIDTIEKYLNYSGGVGGSKARQKMGHFRKIGHNHYNKIVFSLTIQEAQHEIHANVLPRTI